MDRIAFDLRDMSDRLEVPRTVPGLVSRRLLVRRPHALLYSSGLAWHKRLAQIHARAAI